MIELIIFGSTFILVFGLGFQSLNVNNGHYLAAFLTSFVIGGSNLVLFKTVPQADVWQILAYLSGGPFGIVASMYVHRRYMKKPEFTHVRSQKTYVMATDEAIRDWPTDQGNPIVKYWKDRAVNAEAQIELMNVSEDVMAFFTGFEQHRRLANKIEGGDHD